MSGRVVYLSASSGGGHDGVALALSTLGREHFGTGIHQETVDFYGGGHLRAFSKASRVRYHSDLIWRTILRTTDNRLFTSAVTTTFRPLAMPWLKTAVTGHVDAIIAVHFGAARCVRQLAESMSPRPRTAIVITDYEPHWAWFGEADVIVVPSETAVQRARAAGYRDQDIILNPLLPCRRPTHLATWSGPNDSSRLRILAAAGSDGTSANRLTEVLCRLDQGPVGDRFDIEVVCGRGAALQKEIDALAHRLTKVRLRTAGFVTDLPERLAAADVALLRAGPQSVTESIAAGTPVMVFDWHVHEQPNAKLVENLGVGYGSRQPGTIVQHLETLASRPEQLQELQRNVRDAARNLPDVALAQQLFGRLVPNQPTGDAASRTSSLERVAA